MKKFFSVDNDFVNSRIDRWFKRKICEVPQSLIERSLRKGDIRVNYNKIKSAYKLKKEDKILVKNLNFTNNKNIHKKYIYKPTKKDFSESTNMIIENNDDFVVINKPSGIPVQSGTNSRRNILDILANFKEFNNSKPYPVHRLDKETTGILIVAKNRKYAQLFTTLFRIRKIHKIYLGICIGTLKENEGVFDDDLFHYEGKKKIITNALTTFKVLDKTNNYSLLKLVPQTGRKHQIRKQLLIRGCPILGDDKYRILKNKSKIKSQLMLHAYKIKFSISEKKYNFEADLPKVFIKTAKEKYLKNF